MIIPLQVIKNDVLNIIFYQRILYYYQNKQNLIGYKRYWQHFQNSF